MIAFRVCAVSSCSKHWLWYNIGCGVMTSQEHAFWVGQAAPYRYRYVIQGSKCCTHLPTLEIHVAADGRLRKPEAVESNECVNDALPRGYAHVPQTHDRSSMSFVFVSGHVRRRFSNHSRVCSKSQRMQAERGTHKAPRPERHNPMSKAASPKSLTCGSPREQ